MPQLLERMRVEIPSLKSHSDDLSVNSAADSDSPSSCGDYPVSHREEPIERVDNQNATLMPLQFDADPSGESLNTGPSKTWVEHKSLDIVN